MKRFHFPLDRVMEWRDRRAESERMQLQRLHNLRASLASSRAELEAVVASNRVVPPGGDLTSACDLHQLAAYVEGMRRREQLLRVQEGECHQAVTRQTEICLNADRDHKLLVKLRDRRLASWTSELDRETEHAAAESWLAGRARSGALGKNGG